MATKEQMKALLSVACPWCGAGVGQRCQVTTARGRMVLTPTTLDGESHDARWKSALGLPSRVLTTQVDRLVGRESLAAAGAERPW